MDYVDRVEQSGRDDLPNSLLDCQNKKNQSSNYTIAIQLYTHFHLCVVSVHTVLYKRILIGKFMEYWLMVMIGQRLQQVNYRQKGNSARNGILQLFLFSSFKYESTVSNIMLFSYYNSKDNLVMENVRHDCAYDISQKYHN